MINICCSDVMNIATYSDKTKDELKKKYYRKRNVTNKSSSGRTKAKINDEKFRMVAL